MYLKLAPPEFDRLRELARYELREPRAQAEFLLREALRSHVIPPSADTAGDVVVGVADRDLQRASKNRGESR